MAIEIITRLADKQYSELCRDLGIEPSELLSGSGFIGVQRDEKTTIATFYTVFGQASGTVILLSALDAYEGMIAKLSQRFEIDVREATYIDIDGKPLDSRVITEYANLLAERATPNKTGAKRETRTEFARRALAAHNNQTND